MIKTAIASYVFFTPFNNMYGPYLQTSLRSLKLWVTTKYQNRLAMTDRNNWQLGTLGEEMWEVIIQEYLQLCLATYLSSVQVLLKLSRGGPDTKYFFTITISSKAFGLFKHNLLKHALRHIYEITSYESQLKLFGSPPPKIPLISKPNIETRKLITKASSSWKVLVGISQYNNLFINSMPINWTKVQSQLELSLAKFSPSLYVFPMRAWIMAPGLANKSGQKSWPSSLANETETKNSIYLDSQTRPKLRTKVTVSLRENYNLNKGWKFWFTNWIFHQKWEVVNICKDLLGFIELMPAHRKARKDFTGQVGGWVGGGRHGNCGGS